MGQSPGREIPWFAKAAAAALLVLAAAAYSRAFGAAFQFDDLITVHRNAKLVDLGRFLEQHFLADWASGGRALTELTFALDHSVAGWSTFQFHLTSVLLHLATMAVLLLFTQRVLRRVGIERPFPWALAVTAIWGLHPIQTEAVTYVCQRAEVLAALFTVISVHLLLGAEEHYGTRRGALAYAGALLAFAAGIGSKTTAIVIPALYMLGAECLASATVDRGVRLKRVAVIVLPFLAIGLIGGIKVLNSLRGLPDAGFDMPGITVGRYLLTQARVILLYLRLLFWPAGQTVDWDVHLSTTIDGVTLASGLVLAALIGGAAWLFFRARTAEREVALTYRLVAFGVGWFFITLSPTSSVVPLVDLMFEHRVYLASWGIVLAVAALARLALGRVSALWMRPAAVAAGLLLVAALGMATHDRNAVWVTGESLWRDAVAKSPAKPRPHLNLGQALAEQGQTAEALRAYRRGLALDDGTTHLRHLAVAYGNVSTALGEMGSYREGIEAARKGLRLFPESPKLANNLAVLYHKSGDGENALIWANRAITLAPHLADGHVTLGLILNKRGDVQGALREFRNASKADPESENAAMALAATFEQLGDVRQACEWWARAARLAKAPKQRGISPGRLQALGCGRR